MPEPLVENVASIIEFWFLLLNVGIVPKFSSENPDK